MNRATIIAFLTTISISAWTQLQPPPPQTARQALLEMFLSKSPQALEKHLPPSALMQLRKANSNSLNLALVKLTALSDELRIYGSKLETFDAGPTLVLIQDPQQHQRVEVTVERDDLSENEDEIEVSIHLYKDEQAQPLPLLPRLTFRMQEETKYGG
jgi:hypothetical protein